MTDIVMAIRIILFTSLIFISSACNSSPATQTVSDFEKLCDIYKTVAKEFSDSNDLVLREGQLALKIQEELPNMLDDYEHVTNAVPEERYQLYQQVAEIRIEKKWDCPTVRSYYSRS